MLQHWYVLLILAVIALIIFGPKRLPELGEGLGRAIKEFRKATTDVADTLREDVHRTDVAPTAAPGTTYIAPAEPVAPVVPAPPHEAPRA